MENTLQDFRKRQEAVHRKHSRMAKGYVNKLDKTTGVIVQQPDSKTGGIGLRVLVFLGLFFMAFKGFVLAWLGEEAFLGHVAELQTGSTVEQAGAWLMQIDPVTARIAEVITPFLG
ncbi:hypothetical protein [Tropicibacter naphthalenivorans]|uniref:Uncharacterized protein n=1 Tax=Tropicibacter naphthalenivorans TaxID=441103 RepID=A0A0N7LZV4_9RHOB|nr:hypothetical protein [Tropicibacter naphthalenivorans]CUH78713.1 hypothetical protein TRN7648_02125 [Tropicibacter naphthalenivorans]SMC81302.1 hypothetical protein SAMN04488093_104287 [Tropicibacter naphthalenivorans]